ncbi:MAG: KH domain-containing protein [Bacilli bacterium]|nr:KH domain-containing protein [Bacilli bacterium]MBQ4254838.1 KH domain-containing protein [Bacilli bacterium]
MAEELLDKNVDETVDAADPTIDWDKVIHAIIDPLIERPDHVMITLEPSQDKRNIHLVIVAEDSDTARLVGKRGVIANALRDVIGVAPKACDTNERVFIKFESFGQEE